MNHRSEDQPQVGGGSRRTRQRLLRARAVAATAGLVLYPTSFAALFIVGLTEYEDIGAWLLYLASFAVLVHAVTSLALLVLAPKALANLLQGLALLPVIVLAARPLWRWWTIETVDYLARSMYAILPMILVMLILVPWSWVSDQAARSRTNDAQGRN